ncbi:MAG: DUF2752 domain-containing protein [Dysgonamonadaceae bacterium]|jgi:hypothetical protein|nr:DUF2752 domain-containing protein [Dysgonamonadaceae bacterium]
MTFKRSIFVLVAVALVVIYYIFNPQNNSFFPQCPVFYLTGLKCPGCGSQRAIHHLLHLDFYSALKTNLLLVFSIPYLILGLVFEQIKRPTKTILKLRKILYGQIAIIIVLIIIILFSVFRNVIHGI